MPTHLKLLLTLLLLLGVRPLWAAKPGLRGNKTPFSNEVTIKVEGEYRLIQSNGIPNHETGDFPGKGNPNTIGPQKYDFRVPANPKIAENTSAPRMQPFGIAVNGVVFDPGAAEWWNGDHNWQYEPLTLAPLYLGTDASHAHVQPNGAYHYHGIPVALVQALTDGKEKMVIVGWAADGFPIYNSFGHTDSKDAKSALKVLKSSFRVKEGTRPSGPGGAYDGKFVADYEYVKDQGDLDECNGRVAVTPDYPDGIYHYVLTKDFPFIPRQYRGTPDPSFQRGPGPGGLAGGPRGVGPGGTIHVIPRYAQDAVKLTAEQQPQVEALDKEVKEKLEKILTPEQMKTLQDARPPGGPGSLPGVPGGAGGNPGVGGQPGVRPPSNPSPAIDNTPKNDVPSNTPAPTPAIKPTINEKSATPNVLILLVDDLGWNGVGFHDPQSTTPNLNRLAKEGLELQRFYTYPVCSPARAALLSGQMPRRFGIVDALGPQQAGMPKGTITLPGTFRAAGYQTSLIGKWHLGIDSPPLQIGFEHFYGFMSAEVDYFKHTDHRGVIDWQRDGKTVEEMGYSTYLFADEAIRQLKQRDTKRPFFMEVAFNAPHFPLAAPEELLAKHKLGGGVYAAVVEGMDIAIGRILSALDEQGLRDNTLVVFYSDNGATRRDSNNTPLSFGKDTIYEGGIRTPAIVRWPGHTPVGAVSQQPISGQDWFPTIAAAAGVPVPENAKLDGRNQWPSLQTGKPIDREPFLIASHDIALIDGDWKLIEWVSGQHSLFNLRTDISETKDEFTKQTELSQRLLVKLTELKKDLPAAPARRGPGGGPPGKNKTSITVPLDLKRVDEF